MQDISECIQYIQSNLIAKKNLKNSFGGYSYRSFEGILESAKPLLAETGCHIISSDEVVMLGNRFYVKAEVTLCKGNDKITAIGYARESEVRKGMDDSQITGSASSYARKYAINGLFAIDADHFDNTKNHYITEEQIGKFDKYLQHECFKGKKNDTKSWWSKLFDGSNPYAQAEQGLKQMQKRIDEFNSQIKEEKK